MNQIKCVHWGWSQDTVQVTLFFPLKTLGKLYMYCLCFLAQGHLWLLVPLKNIFNVKAFKKNLKMLLYFLTLGLHSGGKKATY